MVLVFGGAFQGKLDFVLEKFGLSLTDVCDLNTLKEIDYNKDIIYGIEAYVERAVNDETNPIEYFETNLEKLKDKIIICTDISCGVVPLEREQRLLRDNTGKIMQILSRESDEVYRVFCGLAERLK